MCGVAGIVVGGRSAPPDMEALRRMAGVLAHRGPDGYGLYRDDRAGLAHTRLSIVDRAGGAQPMADETGRYWLSFNGEIFNHIELRAELTAKGHRFATRSDTEVILHAFTEWGTAAWERFNGQFAFALWDSWRQTLLLVRDRLGILPLFYAHTGDGFVFGSEVKALFASGLIEARFSAARLAQVFMQWSVAPHGSVFHGVHEVPAGGSIALGPDLAAEEYRWWLPDFAADPAQAGLPLEDAADRLEEVLSEAVRLRLRADVPVAVYVSGGLDSAVIAALARREDAAPVHSFGVGFTDPDFDETETQLRLADALGTEHHTVRVGPEEIAADLSDTVWHAETPLLRTAPAPLRRLSGLVRDAGLRVVLTGEGADELFAGYDLFKQDAVRRFWARHPESAARPRLLGRIHAFETAGAKDNPMWRQFFRHGFDQVFDPFYAHRIRWRNTAWGLRLLTARVRDAAADNAFDTAIAEGLPPGWWRWTPLARAQATEILTFLTPYLLASQGDRVAMANGVEARYPFLDPAVVDAAAALPDRAKRLGLRDKLVLRRLAARLLPQDIVRRPKRPYRAPTTAALFGESAPPWVAETLAPERLARHNLVDAEAVAALAARARDNGGRLSSEREAMALTGVVTLQRLADLMLDELPDRVRAGRACLDRLPCAVLEDRAGTATGSLRAC
jgi:asparagine synthase (glutamine-hydrolysing)